MKHFIEVHFTARTIVYAEDAQEALDWTLQYLSCASNIKITKIISEETTNGNPS